MSNIKIKVSNRDLNSAPAVQKISSQNRKQIGFISINLCKSQPTESRTPESQPIPLRRRIEPLKKIALASQPLTQNLFSPLLPSISCSTGKLIVDLFILCNRIGLKSSRISSNESSKPFTLYFRIRGRSSMIPATLIPMLTSTADQRNIGAASTWNLLVREIFRVGKEGVMRPEEGWNGAAYRVDLLRP